MATVIYAGRALEQLERAFRFLSKHNPGAARHAAEAIVSGVDTLRVHPLVGRRIEGDLRELVISYGQSGYVALYRFVVPNDEVRVLAIRHQRELGYLP